MESSIVYQENAMDEEEKRRHFNNALSNYAPIIERSHGDLGEVLQKADEGLSFPESPTDILEYLGNIEPLGLTESEKNSARHTLQKIIDKHGTQHVWDARLRYKCEIEYVYHVF